MSRSGNSDASANNLMPACYPCSKSLIQIWNKSGLKTNPYYTPALTFAVYLYKNSRSLRSEPFIP